MSATFNDLGSPTKNNAQQRPLLVKGNIIILQANQENRGKRERTRGRGEGNGMLENICISFAKQSVVEEMPEGEEGEVWYDARELYRF